MNRLSEVVFPVSRAVAEDESEYTNRGRFTADPKPVFRWNKKLLSKAGKLECKCLLIAIGPVATGFLDSLFSSEGRETVCSISCGGSNLQRRTWSQTAPSDASSFIWRKKGSSDLALCECRETVSTQQLFSWVQQLFAAVKPSTVVVLGSQRIGELKTRSDVLSRASPYPLLSLRSSTLTATPCCPFLQPPNTVGGLAAEVLTYCEVRGLPAVMYVTYVSDRDPLAQLMAAFMPVLSCPIVKPFIPDISKQLAAEEKMLYAFMKDTGSLYI